MPVRPGWHDEYWEQLDKDTARNIRSTCPRCGSAHTDYNKNFKTFRCGKCEYIYVIEGYDTKVPWWKRLFGRRD